MSRRAEAQLRLQQTVEGLSAAAFSIPLAALATLFGVRHVRSVVTRAAGTV